MTKKAKDEVNEEVNDDEEVIDEEVEVDEEGGDELNEEVEVAKNFIIIMALKK